MGDFQGHLTYIGYQGSSTVDLVLVSETNCAITFHFRLNFTLRSQTNFKLYKNNLNYFENCNLNNAELDEKQIRCKYQENCKENFIKVPEKEVECLHNLKDKNNTKDNIKNNNNTNNYTKKSKY